MTARYFCDICTHEVESAEPKRSFRTEVVLDKPPEGHTAIRQVGLEVTRSIDGAWNAGHICNPCLVKSLTQAVLQLGYVIRQDVTS